MSFLRRVAAAVLLLAAALLIVVPHASGQAPPTMYIAEVYRGVTPTPTPTTPPPTPTPGTNPGLPAEIRGVWVSRLDWEPQSPDHGAEMQRLVDDVARAGFNTIFFQVRASGDAYYTPGLEPWAPRLTGTSADSLGQDPGWDPLGELLWRAHAAGLKVHAWMNVAPAWQAPPESSGESLTPPDLTAYPPALVHWFSWSKNGGYGLKDTWRVHNASATPMPIVWNAYLAASPGVPEVRQHVAAVARDIATRYAVDGMHLDYVRFPGGEYSYDLGALAQCGSDGGCVGDRQRDEWTQLVAGVAAEVRAVRPGTLVSAAVWPQYRNQVCVERPPSPDGEPRKPLCITTNLGYKDLYQDAYRWLAAGYVDFVAPMLYTWSTQALLDGAYDQSRSLWTAGVADHLASAQGGLMLPGIGAYDASERSSLPFEEIAARIQIARDMGARGHVIYPLRYLRGNDYLERLRAGPYATPAPWPQ